MLLNSHPVIDQSVSCMCACLYTYTLQPVSACKKGKFIVALILMLPLLSVAFTYVISSHVWDESYFILFACT